MSEIEPSVKLETDQEQSYLTNKWSRTVSQPALITLMTTALFAAILNVIHSFSPNPIWLWLIPLVFIVALEGVYTTIWLAHPQRRILDRTAYHLSELFVLLLITRLYTWALSGEWPQLALAADYLKYPWRLILDIPFIIGALLVVMAWFRARAVSETFTRLDIDEAEVNYYTQEVHQREMGNKPVMTFRGDLAAAFFQHWVWGGMVAAVCVALASVDIPSVTTVSFPFGFSRLQLPASLLLSVIIYFVAGMALVSQARLATLNARWLHDGMQKSPRVERSWLRFGVILVIVLAVVAAFLPLGSTFAVGRLLEALILGAAAVASFISFLVILITSLFLSLFFRQGTPPAPVTPEPLPTLIPTATPIPAATAPPAADDTTTILLSSMFWALALFGAVTALSFYLRGRGVRPSTQTVRLLWASLRGWLRELWQGVAEQADEVRLAVRQRLQQEKKTGEKKEGKRPFRFIRINGLTPRQQIRYFYLSTVKRASSRGVEREESETPLEFMADLQENWPEASEELDALTDAFLQARYGRHSLSQEDVQRVKKRWQSVKGALKKQPYK
ncbi:MAG TPA: DUF4129 domain-containing protein [Anaerolineae bacterium]|nr:DUF4129 domain-containing protein [Anaerolineae bacterium]HIP71532.1 DUF4129 domain-containing protein [Anaerolineae bacterium]